MDTTGDAVTDCYAPDGQVCTATVDQAGDAEDCATDVAAVVLSISHSFTFDDPHTVSSQEVLVTSPFDELDNDGDGYIECTGFDLALFQSSGSDQAFSIVGGSDCDDYDDVVYPAATEFCDGQYNDCDDASYSADGAPDDEVDGATPPPPLC